MHRPLDRIDFDILDALHADGRLSNKELAAKVGLAPSSCLQRVRRLRDENILRGFHADVAPEALGIRLQALLFLRLAVHERTAFERFFQGVLELPEVVAAYRIAGADDVMVHVAVRDSRHLHDLTLDQFTAQPEVQRIETTLIFDHHRAPRLPRYDTGR